MMSDDQSPERTSLQRGADVIRAVAQNLPDKPGVYRMLSETGEALYVGKAKSLTKRVRSYTHINKLPVRLQRMVALTRSMEFVHTHTEAEALLLESNLIKKLKPRYNVLLRDDKSFPYILITGDHDYPLVTKHRGARKRKGQYYGPFASAGDVNRTIAILQRIFMLRNCPDTVFANRSRPCLQYHIKRCTAPCVDKVSKEGYAAQVAEAEDFLEGRSAAIQKRMATEMKKASADMRYEDAAHYRDRIQALSAVQARQDINIEGLGDADVMALVQEGGQSCIQVFFFRAGRNYGNRSYFPRHAKDEDADVIMAAFIAQFYENKPVPPALIVSQLPEERELLIEALSQKAGRRVDISRPQKGTRRKLIDFALRNARAALLQNMSARASEEKLLRGVAELFDLEDMPRRIEVYDNSHISGTHMVGGMIVAGPEGFQKNAYRKFNIKTADEADDYGMMREVVTRRFKKALKEDGAVGGEIWPDLLLIDGGQGQYNAVKEILEEHGIFDSLTLVSIAKGEDRNAGREKFFIEGRKSFQLPENDPVLHYLQRLRDEAHRFAIGAHRTRREKAISSSPLDDIPGVGAARKKALLHYFGSTKAVAQAGVEDLEKVQGVSKSLARKIYDYFH
ncbi:MAG: excinuclease ABC subunit UvrC [Alphaproteobacteria bacterium]|nr:excinuclease ABC subunit UvrC [Alphaproteobacteria bacterium]